MFAILGLCLSVWSSLAQAEEKEMKIKLSVNNQEVIIRLQDNPAAAQLVDMLPAAFEFRDFAGEEKITNFPRPVSLEGAPRGMIATAGKMFIYAPWKNLGIFYKTHSLISDSSLIELGKVESGLDVLAAQDQPFRAQMKIVSE